jgi:hypothetical protein
LITKPLILNAKSMTVNARIVGNLRIRLVGKNGAPVRGFDWIELKGDEIAHIVNWPGDWKNLKKKAIRIEFELKDAQLFGFDLKD